MSHTTRPKGACCLLPELYLGLKALYCSDYILPWSKIQILLRTVWEETRVAALPSQTVLGKTVLSKIRILLQGKI